MDRGNLDPIGKRISKCQKEARDAAVPDWLARRDSSLTTVGACDRLVVGVVAPVQTPPAPEKKNLTLPGSAGTWAQRVEQRAAARRDVVGCLWLAALAGVWRAGLCVFWGLGLALGADWGKMGMGEGERVGVVQVGPSARAGSAGAACDFWASRCKGGAAPSECLQSCKRCESRRGRRLQKSGIGGWRARMQPAKGRSFNSAEPAASKDDVCAMNGCLRGGRRDGDFAGVGQKVGGGGCGGGGGERAKVVGGLAVLGTTRERGKFGVRGRDTGAGDGLCFLGTPAFDYFRSWARENRGPDHQKAQVTDPREILFWKRRIRTPRATGMGTPSTGREGTGRRPKGADERGRWGHGAWHIRAEAGWRAREAPNGETPRNEHERGGTWHGNGNRPDGGMDGWMGGEGKAWPERGESEREGMEMDMGMGTSGWGWGWGWGRATVTVTAGRQGKARQGKTREGRWRAWTDRASHPSQHASRITARVVPRGGMDGKGQASRQGRAGHSRQRAAGWPRRANGRRDGECIKHSTPPWGMDPSSQHHHH